MKLKIFFILLLYTSAFCQEDIKSDSLFNLYLKIKNPSVTDIRILADTTVTKCGFSVVNYVRLNYDKFTPEQQVILLKAFQRPTAQVSVLSPGGYFRVHYDTSGINTLGYSLSLLLQALDSSYNFEVHHLGYFPPQDNNSGGDDKYDIYIQNTGSLYGYTELEDLISGSNNRYTSFMVLDNDFTHTATRGIDGARVTAAHELHHAIQIGSYGYFEQDIYFHEISSTAMEEFVFDSIDDYYYYMDDYFDAPEIPLPQHNGYDSAIWNIFLKEEFDFNILKRQWDLLINNSNRAIDAVAMSVAERGSTFQQVFNKFGIWIYFTGYRSIEGRYFEEAENYPVIRNLVETTYTPPSDTLEISARPVSHNYLTLTNNIFQGTDTLTILITYSDYKKASSNPTFTESITYELYSDSADGLMKLADGYFSRFNNNAFWASSEFINNQLVSEGFNRLESAAAFPMPFKYSVNSFIYFPVKKNNDNEVELYIYSPSMNLVYNSRKDISLLFGKEIISWNGRTSENHKLGSGVYVYVIKSGDDYSKGKIVLFND